MKRRKVSYWKEAHYILSIVGAIVAAALTVWCPHCYLDLRKAQSELQVQKVRVDELKRANEDARSRVRGLKSDPRALERVARERGYAKGDEIILQLPPEPPPQKQK